MRKIGLIVVTLLEGCMVSSGIRPLRPREIASAPYHEGGRESFVGSLMYEGGCLLFDGENGSPRLLPIWPIGTKFEESLVTFHQPAKSDQRLVIGEEIRLDGEFDRLGRARSAHFRAVPAAMRAGQALLRLESRPRQLSFATKD